MSYGAPKRQGLYDPAYEKDACGVGFVAHVKGVRSHQIVLDADEVLRNMDHRGACGCEANTGDGAGILTALPYELLAKVAGRDLGLAELPAPGKLGAGNVFLPTDPEERAHCKGFVERTVREQGQRVLGWRAVPVDPDGADIGPSARASMPVIEQLLVAADGVYAEDEEDGQDSRDANAVHPGGVRAAGAGGPRTTAQERFERQLYVVRKHCSNSLRRDARLRQAEMFYVCTLSSRLMVYKGMLTPGQLLPFYPDLQDWAFKTHLAMVHSRFSTNTFPSWDRAQPLRLMSHNGEINTLRGNVNSMSDREHNLEPTRSRRNGSSAAAGGVAARAAGDPAENRHSPLFNGSTPRLFPICEPDTSDSGSFDNTLEFLRLGGRSLAEAVMMMIPEAWEKDEVMSPEKRAFYEYHSCMMEPWDGPASIAFTDGHVIGAVLDRNGLRPSRYYLTHDDRVIMASEVGVLPISPENVKEKGRLQPGRMFYVDFERGRLVPDEEIKHEVATKRPYARWLEEQRVDLADLAPREVRADAESLIERMRAFGYTTETLQFMLLPLIAQKRDPLGSMGNDTALACLSDEPRLLYDYFKQLFAQVTNPPIDPIREEIVMGLACYCGPEGNLLEPGPEHCHRLRLPHPILSNEALASIEHMDHRGWRARTIDTTWRRSRGAAGLDASLRRISAEAEQAVDEGYSVLVLSDRACGPDRVPISTLLALGAVHQRLVRAGKRTRIGLVCETGEAREVHHHCLLIGYGADAVNPYLAFEALSRAREDGLLDRTKFPDDATIVEAYAKGVAKGMLKVIAKMGISTLQSYKGAQIFEAVGLHRKVVEQCFTGTPSRIEGVGFDVLAEEAVRRHDLGYAQRGRRSALRVLPNDGQFHWRPRGEKHMWSPDTIANVQVAARTNDREAYVKFAVHANAHERSRCTLRGLLRFKKTTGIPLEEVEPAKEIVKRFVTGAMSFGSIGAEAHETLAVAMNRLGGKSNTGEGGEDPERYRLLPDGSANPRRSAIKQIASGRFGVTINYLTNADEIQIKMAQGAKPGEGGELPGRKVDEKIAAVRHSTPGVGLISPPPHHDIYSIEDLAQLIHDLKNANPSARISVKLVSEIGVGTVAAGVAKAHAEHILVSGHDGGTGASPLTSVKHAGMPWELGIAETHQTLVLNDLRSRVVVQVDGQLKTGRDVVVAALLGAEEFGFSTAPLITLGCIMMRKCHLNTCPVGIATQDPELRAKFRGKPEHLVNYLFMVAEEAREIMARLGFRSVNEMIGRVEVLEVDDAIVHWKAQGIDLSAVLAPARAPAGKRVGVYCTMRQDHGLEKALDNRLIELARPALERGEKVAAEMPIRNVNRTVGTMLSHEIAKAWGEDLLPDGTIQYKFTGSAGQSFGAWLAKGVTLELEGDANDYVGKGLSGGRIVVYPPKESTFASETNILVGNVVLYGAVDGEAFFRGRAAERFCVRNSGAVAVVEGVGDHGCEYMTGGRAVILGPTGRNFAAGMSGGVAYVWDTRNELARSCNTGTVDLERLEGREELGYVRSLVEKHHRHTGSEVAAKVLKAWELASRQFVKVMPREYKRVLIERARREGVWRDGEERAAEKGVA